MARLVHTFSSDVVDPRSGTAHAVQAWAEEREDGRWEGRLLFVPRDGGVALLTPRETTQPGVDAVAHWAGTLAAVYLQGALGRTAPYDGRSAVA